MRAAAMSAVRLCTSDVRACSQRLHHQEGGGQRQEVKRLVCLIWLRLSISRRCLGCSDYYEITPLGTTVATPWGVFEMPADAAAAAASAGAGDGSSEAIPIEVDDA
jgi:hypothetical protein